MTFQYLFIFKYLNYSRHFSSIDGNLHGIFLYYETNIFLLLIFRKIADCNKNQSFSRILTTC